MRTADRILCEHTSGLYDTKSEILKAMEDYARQVAEAVREQAADWCWTAADKNKIRKMPIEQFIK